MKHLNESISHRMEVKMGKTMRTQTQGVITTNLFRSLWAKLGADLTSYLWFGLDNCERYELEKVWEKANE